MRFGTVSVETHDHLHVFRVQVLPGDLPLDDLRVELYAEPLQRRRIRRPGHDCKREWARCKRNRNLLGASSGKPRGQ